VGPPPVLPPNKEVPTATAEGGKDE